jgi:ribosomal protein S18 acetylase RimI-like enzyme
MGVGGGVSLSRHEPAISLLNVDLIVERAAEATSELQSALASLLPQLNPSIAVPDAGMLEAALSDTATTLLVARDGGTIIGTATVIVYTTPAWVKSRIEDVVVDKRARGRGCGEALVKACIEVARQKGAALVELQSARSREEANRLYPRLGFELRQSNVYRLMLD